MSKGWISLYRKTLDNPILRTSRKFSTFEAWIWLLLTVNHKEKKIVLGSDVYNVKKGSMITSQKKLCKLFGWGNSRLRTFLKLLQKDDMVVVKTNQKLTQISLLNYESYQDYKSLSNHKQITSKSLPNTNNNVVNNVNNDNKDIRQTKFIDKVCSEGIKRTPMVDPSVITNFTDYWTESNTKGKMRFEFEKVFDINKRLATWLRNDTEWGGIKNKTNINDFKLDTTGNSYIGRCDVCKKTDFYSKYEIQSSDSRCCKSALIP